MLDTVKPYCCAVTLFVLEIPGGRPEIPITVASIDPKTSNRIPSIAWPGQIDWFIVPGKSGLPSPSSSAKLFLTIFSLG